MGLKVYKYIKNIPEALVLLDFTQSHSCSPFCLCRPKRGCAFPACACGCRKHEGYGDFPLFPLSPFSPVLPAGMGRRACSCAYRLVPFFRLFWETGITKGHKTAYKNSLPDVKRHADMLCAGPDKNRRKQDATPDFPVCLCRIRHYRRHGDSGTGRAPGRTAKSIVAQPRRKPKGRPGHAPVAVLFPLWLRI